MLVCGIFGFVLARPVLLSEVFEVLARLEIHRYSDEETTVGGYGAGITILRGGKLLTQKAVRTGDASPVQNLRRLLEASEASVLISHVRMPSPQFMDNARFRETAQPYSAGCAEGVSVASAHNGYIENYVVLRERLNRTHVLESEKVELIDSEVIPHCFEEALKANADVEEAVHALYAMLEGRMAVVLLQTGRKRDFLHFLHKGQTRGLYVWTNNDGEIIFISRKETLTPHFEALLSEGRFNQAVAVAWREEKDIKLSYALKS
jgi:glucosamine 6-phosphate synthetase-like amidotransferase/phosphosugar isomerase protein